MERRVFILLVLLIISVILNIFLATKVIKFRKIANSFNEYTSSRLSEYERRAGSVENRMDDRVRSLNRNTVNNR